MSIAFEAGGEIEVNGQRRQLAPEQSLAALVETLGLDPRKVAIERNASIVPRSRYGSTLLLPGDRLEIVHFIGGG